MRAECCTICLQQVEEVLFLPCNHWYCECITTWLREHGTCPLCCEPIEAAGETPSGLDMRTTAGGGMQIIGSHEDVDMSNLQLGGGSLQVILSSEEGLECFFQLMRERR